MSDTIKCSEVSQETPSVVSVSREDCSATTETAYLLRSPANARRLREALDALHSAEPHALAE